MSHEIRRILRAFASQPWFIDPREAEKICALLEWRAMHGPRATPYRAAPAERPPARDRKSNIVVLNMQGPIVPRVSPDDVSNPGMSLERFAVAFDQAAADSDVGAIVINIDSPGGTVDLVPETAAKIRGASDPSRPIIAVANTMAASAAYWLGSAADELVVTESGEVGSIGVWTMHEDISAALEAEGVRVTLISQGARKTEGHPFGPLGDEAARHLQSTTKHYYDLFVQDVAAFRDVDESVVRGDPETDAKHFGGGRTYPARIAVKLGMADKVESLDSVLQSLKDGRRPIRNRRGEHSGSRGAHQMLRRRLALV